MDPVDGIQPPTREGLPLLRQLEALVSLVRELGRARDARELYDPALTALHAISGVERSAILLLDDTGTSRFVAWRGLSAAYRAAAEGHLPWPADVTNPRPIAVPDVEKEPLLATLGPELDREGIRALAFIPLVYRERLVGRFMLYFDRPHDFSETEVEFANAVAYLIAFAIERTRLYAAVKDADQRKDTFLATLSHELRNPLAPASAALALMAEHPDDLASLHRSRDVLDRSVRQIVKLVDDLLDVSRITRGVVAITKQEVDLASIVRHAIAPVEALVVAQRQELTLALEPLWLEADPLRLEQIVTNLVHNAAKYTPPGGHIRIATGAKDGGVEIRVEDDGSGIDPSVIEHLFDLFMRGDTSLARSRGGLGIGLTIVRELVELHGGKVSVASLGAGRGAAFTVWLPGRVEPKSPLPRRLRDSPRPSHGRRRRILVVDDNEDAAMMLAELLHDWGQDVTTAFDGPAALAAVAELHPEMVLLDLGLPGMNGFEVAERLRASGEQTMRIVAVSGYGQPEDVAHARASGCDAHVAKPVDLDVLDRLLADVPC